jgi:CHRD domain
MGNRGLVALATALLCSATTSAYAQIRSFRAELTGKAAPTNTGSSASGVATVRVDTVKSLVSIDLRVEGITLDELWDNLVSAPIGPIHFHQYGSTRRGDSDVSLALPLPYGPAYKATKSGFRVTIKQLPYATTSQLVKSTATIDEFVAALQSGRIVLNIHTDRNNDGEISGTLQPR